MVHIMKDGRCFSEAEWEDYQDYIAEHIDRYTSEDDE